MSAYTDCEIILHFRRIDLNRELPGDDNDDADGLVALCRLIENKSCILFKILSYSMYVRKWNRKVHLLYRKPAKRSSDDCDGIVGILQAADTNQRFI